MNNGKTIKEESIGTKIHRLRKSGGFSQEDLACRLGVSRQTISKWESDFMSPAADSIQQLCTLFGVNADYFFSNQSIAEAATCIVTVNRIEEPAAADTAPENGSADGAAPKKKKKKALKIIFIINSVLFVMSLSVIYMSYVVLTPNSGATVIRTTIIDSIAFYCIFAMSFVFLLLEVLFGCLLVKRR